MSCVWSKNADGEVMTEGEATIRHLDPAEVQFNSVERLPGSGIPATIVLTRGGLIKNYLPEIAQITFLSKRSDYSTTGLTGFTFACFLQKAIDISGKYSCSDYNPIV